MHPELEAVRREIEDTRLRGLDLVDSLTSEQINWRFADGTWSIAECIEHLSLTNEQYGGTIASALEGAARNSPPGTQVKYGWLERFLVRQMEPPVKLKFKAPKAFAPASDLSLDTLRKRWESSHRTIIDLVGRADGVPLDKIKVDSPANRFVKLSVGMAFHVIAAHDRRHLWQADSLKEKPGFPESTRGATSR
jgi:hypothetical protein